MAKLSKHDEFVKGQAPKVTVFRDGVEGSPEEPRTLSVRTFMGAEETALFLGLEGGGAWLEEKAAGYEIPALPINGRWFFHPPLVAKFIGTMMEKHAARTLTVVPNGFQVVGGGGH